MSLWTILTPVQATAEDILVAVESSWSRVARIFDGIPTTAEEIQEAAERQRIISQVSRVRQNGIEYYGPYLEAFNALDEESQYQVALAIYPDNAHGGPDLSSEYIELVRNLRVPQEMIEAILAEATENGADEDWDLPAFEEALFQLREAGDIGANTFWDLISFSPDITSKLYIVVVSLATQQRLEEDRRWLEEDRRWLEELREIRRQQEEILWNN